MHFQKVDRLCVGMGQHVIIIEHVHKKYVSALINDNYYQFGCPTQIWARVKTDVLGDSMLLYSPWHLLALAVPFQHTSKES